MKSKSYSTQFVSVKGRLQIRFLVNNKEYKSKLTKIPATTEDLANPSALLNATLAKFNAGITKALYLAELDGVDPFSIVFPEEVAESLLPSLDKYMNSAAKRDAKLRNFCGYIDRSTEWDDLTDLFIEEYKESLIAEEYSDNTIRAYMTGLKVALDKARRDGFVFPALEYDKILRGKMGTSVGVYLTKSEVEAFAAVGTESDLEESVKTLALIGFYVGARFSDYSQLKSANIVSVEYENADGSRDEVKHIQYVSKKTDTLSQIPLKPCVLGLLEKKITAPTHQQMNRILPILAERAGVVAESTVVHGGVTESGPRWKFVRSHSCRHTFAVNVYLSFEYDIRSIAKFLGHKNIETTMGYISCPAVRRTSNIVSWFL